MVAAQLQLAADTDAAQAGAAQGAAALAQQLQAGIAAAAQTQGGRVELQRGRAAADAGRGDADAAAAQHRRRIAAVQLLACGLQRQAATGGEAGQGGGSAAGEVQAAAGAGAAARPHGQTGAAQVEAEIAPSRDGPSQGEGLGGLAAQAQVAWGVDRLQWCAAAA